MSWDQQTYSFGNPNAQPPTPTKTPTSGQFPSPTFETPRNNSNFDNRSGWTPTFAEEYSVFHSTPGRLTGDNSFIDSATPRPSTSTTQSRPLSGQFVIDNSIHEHQQLNNSSITSPTNDPSPTKPYTNDRFNDSARKKVTPRKPRKRLEEAFSGQTATPPQSASKGKRKLAPKVLTENMQNGSQNGHYGTLDTTPIHDGDFSTFPPSSTDMFGYPMSAPATAPVFNEKPFWDTDASMGGMDLDFTTNDAAMFAAGHRISNSFNWGRDNQIFQESMSMPPTQEEVPQVKQPAKRQPRALAPKVTVPPTEVPKPIPPFSFNSSNNSTVIPDDPFSLSMGGSVDPGLLFQSRNNSISMASDFDEVVLPAPRPATSHIVREPYQHQQRELRRDQEELRWSRSTHERSSGRGVDRQTASSPVRGSARPGLHRSASDSRGKRAQAGRIPPRTGRTSPVKQQRVRNLTAIPESPVPKARTEVIFTIDAKGKARTETIIIPEPPISKKPPSLHDEYDSSPCESSTDDELILVPSRNSSFALPQPKGPRLARFEIPNLVNGYSNSESSSQHSLQRDSVESEAETVMEVDDGSGDATRELRKVMENRKNQIKQHNRYGEDQRGGTMYYNSSTNISPTTVTDPDGTPSSTRSGTTRCVCNQNDSEGLMIQCESCDNWLHAPCVNIDERSLPPVYICAFCAQTPKLRGARIREPARASHLGSSPLAHKSFRSFR